tara:strand:- start:532 stop:762 length:231 start_codon:yes stop_codon:yes gene_type:complete
VAKKITKGFFNILSIFKMAAIFLAKTAILPKFGPKMEAILKISTFHFCHFWGMGMTLDDFFHETHRSCIGFGETEG